MLNFGPGAFRLLLAIVVVLSHMSRLNIGVVAVIVFFILSGYWVTRVYWEKYRPSVSPIAGFYTARFLRLWPSFFVALIFAMVTYRLMGEWFDIRQLYAAPLFGVASHPFDPLGVSWSLDIEMQFYLALPLIAPLVARRAAWPVVLPLFAALSACGWLLHARTGIETVAGYLPAFLAGALIYFSGLAATRRAAFASLGLFVAIGAMLLALPETRGVVIKAPMTEVEVRLGSLLWGLSITPFVAWNVRQRGGRHDGFCGNLSYSLYLIHFPVIRLARHLEGGNLPDAMKLVVFVVSLVAAILFQILVDTPLGRWRERAVAAVMRRARPG